MSIYDVDIVTGRTKIQTAIARLHNYCDGKKVLCAFSGGKDSQCVYHLLKDAGIPFKAQYSITRFEPPELIHFIRDNYPDVTFRRAFKRSLVEEIEKKGLPNRWFRWCCTAKHIKTPGFDIAAIGIRWQESARRRMRWSDFGRKEDGTFYVCPIVDWTDGDVWEYLNGKGLPHCSIYDEGYTRIGCVCCPLAPGKMMRDAKRWPKTAAVLLMGHRRNYEALKAKNFTTAKGKRYFIADYTPEESFDFWLHNGSLKMDGEKQEEDLPCLFAGTGFSESDGAKEGE